MVAKIVSVNSDDAVEEVVKVLTDHGVIVYPTETCYGIGCIYDFEDAMKRIFRIKRRSKQKVLPVVVANIKIAKRYAEIPPAAEKLAQVFYPRPITIAVSNEFSFRISSHPFVKELTRKIRRAIVATSANISGESEIYEIKKIKKLFLRKVDLIVDGGNLPKNPPSTVYDVVNFKMIREGEIKEEEILEVLRAFGFLKENS